jgi:ATP-dependent helicase/nuclease subunit A
VSASLFDADARLRAASDLDVNLVVTAGAGTGKTSLLVERMLHLVLSGRTTLARIAALTFTEKAAAEMKRRLAESLLETAGFLAGGGLPGGGAGGGLPGGGAGGGLPGGEARGEVGSARSGPAEGGGEAGSARSGPAGNRVSGEAGRVLARLEQEPTGLLGARTRTALEDLDTALIGTIHGLCADILRRNPQAAGLPPEFTIDDSVSGGSFFDPAWSGFLAEELGPARSREAVWARVLGHFRLDEIEAVARALHGSPASAELLARQGPRPRDARERFGEEARNLRNRLAECLPHVPKRNKKFDQLARTEISLLDLFLEKGTEALRGPDASTPEASDLWPRKNGFSAGTDQSNPLKAEMEELAERAMKLLQKLRTVREREIGDLLEALLPFALRRRHRVLHEGLVSFDDLLLLTRDLLRDVPEARRRESGRFDVLLVDEFQDTDPLQYEIVFFLAAREDAHESDPYAIPLRPGRLFIVGDPKQSIYRFRGADMAAYHRAVKHVTAEGAGASLTVNFRSVPEVIDAVNRLFTGWIGEIPERTVEPEYLPIHPFHPRGGENAGVEIWSVRASGESARDRRRAEAAALAREIRAWLDSGSLRPKHVALLFRALTDIPLYTRALRRAGIDFVVEGGKAFAERPEVVESFALLRALANPGDAVPLLGVLRSSFGGATDAELAAFVRSGGVLQWISAQEGVPPRIAGVFARLRDQDVLRLRLPLDRWILITLTESEFLLTQAAYEDGPQRVANVRKLAHEVASLVRERGLTLEEALNEVEEVFTGDRTEGESPLADEAVDAVRILSIHKAKGLEFRVVVVPDLARGSGSGRSQTRVEIVLADRGPEIAISIPGRAGALNGAGLAAQRERERHEEAEAKRLLYVATTRAVERLVLIHSSTNTSASWVKALARLGYAPEGGFPPEGPLPMPEGSPGDSPVIHRILDGTAPLGTRDPGAATDVLPAYRSFLAAREIAARPAAPRFRNPSRDHRVAATDHDEADVSGASRPRDLARAAGVAVHRLLENWDFRDQAALRARAGGAAAFAARELGQDPAVVAREVLEVLEGFLDSELPAHLAAAEILGREVPILFRDPDGSVVHGYADLIYRREGRVYVADYKTDVDTGEERAASYRAQLAEYARAVEAALGLPEPPICEVLFVRGGRRVALPGEPGR